jgi:multidrug transporter EmrE-like cation transporter
MTDSQSRIQVGLTTSQVWITALLLGANVIFNVVSNASFKASADARAWRAFLAWQVAGNLAGFATVVTLTVLLRRWPLHVAFPVTTGLAVIGVQVVGAHWIYHESIRPAQWLGTSLVVAGIWLIGAR